MPGLCGGDAGLLLAAASLRSVAAADTASIQIVFQQDLLTLQAEDTGLCDLLGRLGVEAGFQVRSDGVDCTRRNHWSLRRLSLSRGIARLLSGYSYLSIHDTRGRLVSLHVIGEDHGAETGYRLAQVERLEGMRGGDVVERLGELLQRDPDAAVRSQAAAAPGVRSDLESVMALGRAVMGDPEPRVRLSAVRVLATHPHERAGIFLDAARQDPDGEVRGLAARLMASGDAER